MQRCVREGPWLGRRTVPASENRLESSFILWLNLRIGQVNLSVVFRGLHSHCDRRGSHFLRSKRSHPQAQPEPHSPGPGHTSSLGAGVAEQRQLC